HWKDKRLQSMQQVREAQDKTFSYLALYRPDEKKFVRIADEKMRQVAPAPEQKFAVGIDDDDYELQGNLDGRRFEDVYVIDLRTGERRLAVKKARWAMGPSPTGTHLLYYDDGNFFVYDMASGRSTNVTKGVPTSFINTEDDHNIVKPPRPSLG